MKKNVVFLISEMHMGGAERILSAIASYCSENGRSATVILTQQSLREANLSRLSEKVKVISLTDELEGAKHRPAGAGVQMLLARLQGKLGAVFGEKMRDLSSIRKFYARNFDRICWLRGFLRTHGDEAMVAFLYDSIFLTLLASRKTNRVIISDRGDPQQSVSSKTDMAFFRRMFPKADCMVFQSPGVRDWYRTHIGLNGRVIFNPVKDGLPRPWDGIRRNHVVNFCRITPQKNPFLLLESFEKFAEVHPEYELYLYGDPDPNERSYVDRFLRAVEQSSARDKIHIYPARSDIHEEIVKDAMFVSSSDFEGMSNSMLEAMALGLPTICTDCPAGGARAVIQDHENGLLVPVGDRKGLYLAMKEVVDAPDLAQKLSKNGRKIRETQAPEKIMKQWMEIIDG